jgi:hypothetical protein
MIDKSEAIKATMQRWMREPFEWGQSDCMLSVADYLIHAVGFDCGTRFRGKYYSRLGCARLSGFHIDPVKPFADCVAEIPLKETKSPVRGDVGVIEVHDTVAGGICLGKAWAVRGETGLVIARPTRILKAWAV